MQERARSDAEWRVLLDAERATSARLEQAVAERDRQLGTAREALAATQAVLRAINDGRGDAQAVLDAIVERAGHLLDADGASLHLLFGEAQHRVAGYRRAGVAALQRPGSLAAPGDPFPATGTMAGRAIAERRSLAVADFQAVGVREYPGALAFFAQLGLANLVRSQMVSPLLRKGEPIGVLVVNRFEVRPFTTDEVRLLETFAEQAVIAIENARLFSELQISNRDLTEALEQQTVTAEVLGVISRSPTDLQAVLDTIAESAARLCGTDAGLIRLAEGDIHRAVAGLGRTTNYRRRVTLADPGSTQPLSRDNPPGRAILDREVLHIPDLDAVPVSELPATFSRAIGMRTVLNVPLIRQGEAIGVIVMGHAEVRPFTDRQIALVKTFADQAVIAIENARLFSELQERTDQLTHSVERLTALFDVSQAVSASLDLERVLQTVVERAVALSGTDSGVIYEFDPVENAFRRRAGFRESPAVAEATLRHPPRYDGDGAPGLAVRSLRPQQADYTADAGPETPLRAALIADGVRSGLVVPLVADERLLGLLTVRRREGGLFPEEMVRLLQTFATQAALAIQNARLFQALAEKSAQLEEASRHKSEFLANMSHELRTPLNAIIGFTEVLLEKYFGEVNEKQEDYLKDVLSSGQHLLALINDILDLSKVEAGRMELEVAPFDLGPALEAGLVMVKERASKKGIELTLAVAEDVGRVEADERKVKQVVFNLLTNAVKFTPEGGRIAVSARRSDGIVEVAVADTGVGIAAEDLPRIFEEFGQARNQAGQTEGTGLGLALVKGYAELHGGTVRVESVVGRGSVFTLSLPVPRVVAS